MKIEINSSPNLNPVDRLQLRKLVQFLMRCVSDKCPKRQWICLSLWLTDNARITALSHQYLAARHVTDVITFAYPPIPGEGDQYTAEIIVNLQMAAHPGPESRRNSPSRELALYIAHGCNHLTGLDDDTPQRRRQMRRRELIWLRAATQKGLLRGLIK
jgi:rRNA maturation RNase YbeY